MDSVKVGSKLYHYKYGPVTVKEIKEGNYLIALIEDMQGLNDRPYWYSGDEGDRLRPIPSNCVVFRKDSIGYWLFEDPKDVAKLVNSGASLVGCPGIEYAHWAMKVDKEKLHNYYRKTGLTEAEADVKTGLTEAEASAKKKEPAKAKHENNKAPAGNSEAKTGLTEINEGGTVAGLTEAEADAKSGLTEI